MNTQTNETTKATLNIGGMACSGCADTVQNALNNIDGVKEATVGLDNESASVLYDPESVSNDDFQQAIEDAGYEFNGIKN